MIRLSEQPEMACADYIGKESITNSRKQNHVISNSSPASADLPTKLGAKCGTTS